MTATHAAARDRTARQAAVRAALAPAGIYLAVRLVGVLGLMLMAATHGADPIDRLRSWDGNWMLAIAQYGYGVPTDMLDGHGNHTPFTAMAFFPGYPAAVTAAGWLTGGDLVVAGLVVSLLAGVVAAYGLTRLGALVPGGSRRAGLLLTGLFAAAPMAVTLNMAYTEALFCALAAWSLVALLERRWLVAGMLCGLAGLVRPTVSALVLAVVVAAGMALARRQDGVRPVVAVLLSVTGVAAYLAWVASRTGSLTGWFTVQSTGWDGSVDGGATTLNYLGNVVGGHATTTYDLVTALTLVGVLLLLGLCVATRVPWPLIAYAAVTVATVWLSSGVMNSKVRLLTTAFVLLLPVAVGLARRRTVTAVAVVAAAAIASAWFGGYALTVWQYAI